MIKRIFPAPLLSLFLVIFWFLLQNKVSMGHLVLGGLLAIIIPLYTTRGDSHRARLHRPFRALQYFLLLLVDIVISNFKIAALILSFKRRLKPALLEYELDLRDDVPITILAATISLTPGTISAEVSKDKRFLLIHALNVDDHEGVKKEIKHRYE